MVNLSYGSVPPPDAQSKNNLSCLSRQSCQVTKTFGYYGITKVYKVFGQPIAVRERFREKEEYRLQIGRWSKHLFSRQLPTKFRIADLQNDMADMANLRQLEKLPDRDQKRVLFVLDYLMIAGGVERRLELQFDWLKRHGIQPILVAEKMEYAPLAKYPVLRFFGYAPNAQAKLVELIQWSKASVVEFNMKGCCLLHDLDIATVKQFARIGCMIHGEIEASQAQLNILDYRCSSRDKPAYFQNVTPIPNVVEFPAQLPRYDARSNKALYIGRIDSDKLKTVQSFVRVCQNHNLQFELAGPLYPQREVVQYVERIGSDHFIGQIDTRSFLQEHGKEYAFIAGVGQIPLEAAAANLPTLIPTHSDDASQSVFLSSENLDVLLDWNCVLRRMPKDFLVQPNLADFFEARSKVLAKQCGIEQLNSYRLRKALQARRNAEEIWGKYVGILFGCRKENSTSELKSVSDVHGIKRIE